LTVHFGQIKQKLEEDKKLLEIKLSKKNKFKHIKSKLHESTECRELASQERKNSSSLSPKKSARSSNYYNLTKSENTPQNSSPIKIKKFVIIANKNSSPSTRVYTSLNTDSHSHNTPYDSVKSPIVKKISTPTVNKFTLSRKFLSDVNSNVTTSPRQVINKTNFNLISIKNTENIKNTQNLDKRSSIESRIFNKIKKNYNFKENMTVTVDSSAKTDRSVINKSITSDKSDPPIITLNTMPDIKDGHLPLLEKYSFVNFSQSPGKTKKLNSDKNFKIKNFDFFSKNDFYYK
jgi:hypothetical protein